MAEAFRLDVGPDRLATLTFDLPGKSANIFTREVVAEFERLVTELARRDDIGCLVLLSAKPRIFIAGADVDAIAHVTDPAEAEEASRRVHRIFAAWEALPFPTVAAIRGTCLGGGTELSLASTYIVASDRADIRIGLPEIKLGILPGIGGTQRLTRAVGKAMALDMILTGRTIDAAEARAVGLVSRVVAPTDLLQTALEAAHTIAGYNSPAVRLAKEAANRAFETTLTEGMLHERRLFQMAFATEGQKEGMRAFAEKRAPVFTNR